MRTDLPRHRFRIISRIALLLFLLLCLTGCSREEAQIRAVNELNGKTIAVEMGAIHAANIKSRPELPDADVIYANSSADGLAMLLKGKADALAVDYVTAQVMTCRYDGVVMLEETLDHSAYGFAFRKGDARIPLFDAAIADLKGDGTVADLVRKWMDNDDTVKKLPEQTWAGDSGVLKCRVSADIEPMCYMDAAGNLAGFDIDLLLHIAEKLDYRVEFSGGSFDDLLPAVAAGQIDMAASGITVTQGRNEIVDFTDGYLEAGTVVLVRDTVAGTDREGALVTLQTSVRRTILDQNRWRDLLLGLWMSIKIILLSLAVGAVFGAAIYLWYYSESRIARCLLGIVSKILVLLPSSTWLLASFYLIFAGNSVNNFWAAVFAFGFLFGFDVFGSLNSAVDSVGHGQVEAAVSMGYGRYEALRRIYLPQALPAFLTSMEGAVIEVIRCTSLVEFIALQDFQATADRIRAESFEPFMTIILTAVVYVLLAMLGSWLVRKLRLRISPSEKTESEIRKKIMKGVGE